VSEPAFVDIHCHLLPGIDDGAKDWRDTLAMARMAAADGFDTIVATPHQLGNWPQNTGDDIRHLTAQVQNVLREQKIPITLLAGGDVRIEPDLIAKIRRGEVMTLADRGRHVLLELPHELYVPLDRLLAELRAAGLVGILSHPERNQGILARPDVLGPLVRAGCLMQVTAGSLAGAFGIDIAKFSEWMVVEGLVHFLATDAHSSRARRPIMSRAFERAAQLVGERRAIELCCSNPARIAAGEDVRARIQRTKQVRPGLTGWFGWRKAG
jgi:protein-tyrosine phosphatase